MNATERAADAESYRAWAEESPNFITPNVQQVETVGPYAVELATGDRIFGDGLLWGVTVAKRTSDGYETGTHDQADLSESFAGEGIAREHFRAAVRALKNREEGSA